MANKPTSTATISVEKVWPPKGRGPYGVIDTKGNRFGVWQDQWAKLNIQEGQTYSVMYESNAYVGQDGSPRTSHNLVSAQLVGNGNPLPQGPQQAPLTPHGQALLSGEDSPKAVNIAVLSLKKGNVEYDTAIANGDVARATKILRTIRLSWLEYLKPVPSMPLRPMGEAEAPDDIPYNDEIPF